MFNLNKEGKIEDNLVDTKKRVPLLALSNYYHGHVT